MGIVRMKKISLVAVRSQKDALLRDLQRLGCVEFSEPEPVAEGADYHDLIARETSELDKYRSDQASLIRGLALLDRYAPEKSSLFEPRQEVSESALLDASGAADALALATRLEHLDSQIKRLSALETQHRSLLESLEPWKELTIPLDCTGTEKTAIVPGVLPAGTELEAVIGILTAAVPEAALLTVSSYRELYYLVLICLKENLPEALDALRACGFAPSPLKDLEGTAAANIENTRKHLQEMVEEKQDLCLQIEAEAPRRNELKRCIDLMAAKIARAEATERLLGTERAVLLSGWVPASEEPKLLEVLSKYNCAWSTADPTPEEYENVPVKLKNNAVTAPLTMVTEMYSLPSYDGVDPNPLMMPFFVLFYGFMMADAGYGLLMIIAALFVKRKKPQGGAKNFFDLLLMCGISTLLFGIATGGFFGDALKQIFGLFGKTFTLPYTPLFDPLNDTQLVLVGALALGAFQVLVGMAISFIKQTADGHFLDALFDVGSWWLLFAGIALGALGVTWWVAIAGVAALVLTQGRSKPTIIGKLASGIGSLYNITGYFGDILSYSRLMALMLAGGVIAQVFNTLAALTGNIVTFFLIFLVGHALNLGLNLLGCYVHDLRLQCLEFFGKFYKDGGRPFSPLKFNTKYTTITK